jgi:DNA polymerase kappa
MAEFEKVTAQELESAQRVADEYILQCERRRKLTKVLVHIDMDAFYANVEIRDNPKLAERPMAVGSDSMLVT